MDQIKIGEFIAYNRKNKGLTQEQLAEKLGITSKTISRWETGKYMPDLSLLTILSKELNVSINDLINGEIINENDLLKKSEQNLVDTINYSQNIIKKKNKKFILLILIFIICTFCIFDYIYFTPCTYHNGDTSKWSSTFPNHSAYEIGLNSQDQPVFKNPSKALNQAKVDYSDAIKEIQNKFKLLPLTKYTYRQFGIYGWQIASDNEMINEQGRQLSRFIDIYENSFR